MAALFAAGAALEIWLRAGEGPPAGRQAESGDVHDLFYSDENGTPRIKENAFGLHEAYDPGEPVLIQINSRGFRGREPLDTPTRRVVFVGDSIVFSGGLWLKDTFVKKTERLINARRQLPDPPVETLNLGMTDTGIAEYLLKIEHHALGLNPAAIVLGFYLNDSRPPQGFLGEDGSSPAEQSLKRSVFYRLRTVQRLHKVYRHAKFSRNRELAQRFRWAPRFFSGAWVHDEEEWRLLYEEADYDWGAAWSEASWQEVESALARMAGLCRESGVRLLLVCFPASPQTVVPPSFPDYRKPQDRLQAIARRLAIPLLDLLPRLRKIGSSNLFVDQCHLTAWGSEVVARELAPWLAMRLREGEPP